jgi:drug/metabolite transporter (DMT)-like permease
MLLTNGLKVLKAQQVSSITSLEVVYGIIFAMIILHEIPPFKTIIGGIIIFSVTIYLTYEAQKTPPLPKKDGTNSPCKSPSSHPRRKLYKK